MASTPAQEASWARPGHRVLGLHSGGAPVRSARDRCPPPWERRLHQRPTSRIHEGSTALGSLEVSCLPGALVPDPCVMHLHGGFLPASWRYPRALGHSLDAAWAVRTSVADYRGDRRTTCGDTGVWSSSLSYMHIGWESLTAWSPGVAPYKETAVATLLKPSPFLGPCPGGCVGEDVIL